jgi:hypothetical protein
MTSVVDPNPGIESLDIDCHNFVPDGKKAADGRLMVADAADISRGIDLSRGIG